MNSAPWEPYTTTDLFATYQIDDQVNLDIGIDDANDVYYVSPLAIQAKPAHGRTLCFNIATTFRVRSYLSVNTISFR